jgi:hypothetical protein
VGAGSPPDGIGDVCQCGDVDNNGFVTSVDATFAQNASLNLPPYTGGVTTLPGYLKCDADGDGLCSSTDAILIGRAAIGLTAAIKQECPAAMSAVGGGLGNGRPTPTPCSPATFPTIPDLNAEGWLGGDGGASILMPDGSSVWLFGDSFIGPANATDRTNVIVNNSIGTSACNGNSWGALDHFWGQFGTAPAAFFNNPDGTSVEWPFDAFLSLSGSSLYVLLQRVKRTPGVGLGFTPTGTDLAIISTSDPVGAWTNPSEWTQQIIPINTSTDVYPNAAAIEPGDGNVYIYTLLTPCTGCTPMTIVKAPLNDLNHFVTDLQYLSGSTGKWTPLGPGWENDAKHVMDSGASEMTVRWHEAQKEWIAVYLPPFTSQIVMRTAPAPQENSPPESLIWSSEQPIYQVPEMTPGGAGYDPNNVCYAALEHIEWATPKSMVVTYACNYLNPLNTPAQNFAFLETDMSIYYPEPVTIRAIGRSSRWR